MAEVDAAYQKIRAEDEADDIAGRRERARARVLFLTLHWPFCDYETLRALWKVDSAPRGDRRLKIPCGRLVIDFAASSVVGQTSQTSIASII